MGPLICSCASADRVLASCSVTDSDTKPAVRDCIIKIDKAILNGSRDPDGQTQKLSNSNVTITYFDLPTRGSIMHRIIAPGTEKSKLKNVWFTLSLGRTASGLSMYPIPGLSSSRRSASGVSSSRRSAKPEGFT